MQKQWYAVYTQPGYEKRVQAGLNRKILESGKGDSFGDVIVPTERIIDRVRGKKQTVERRIFPGYVLIQAALTDETWHLVRSIPRVLGFVGEGGSPTPMSEEEIASIRRTIEAGNVAPRPKLRFAVGEAVKVVDGPFRDFSGTVQEIKPERSRLRVSISVFGRPTPVELDFIEVEAA